MNHKQKILADVNANRSTQAYVHNPVYIFYALSSLVALFVTSLAASGSTIRLFESSIFNLLYGLPDTLKSLFVLIAILGSVLIAVIAIGGALLFRRQDIALRVFLAAFAAYAIANVLSGWIARSRPSAFFAEVVPRIETMGYGFPSSQAAVLLAAGLTMAVYTPKVYRKWVIYAALLFGCSGIFIGVNLPLDIIAGWLVGLFCYGFIMLTIGSPYRPIIADKLAKRLSKAGMEGVKLKPAKVDARGSVPFFGEYKGENVFVKVFNQDNNAADWLFKLMRRVWYRRLEDEVPSLTPKRAIEHEAYLTMLASQSAGIRAPEVIGIYRVGSNSYAMATKLITSTGLNKIDKSKITDSLLGGVWQQIVQLHKSHIIHKDLRAANVMIEKKTGLPWLIDFGFSECAVKPSASYKDNVEFIASSASKVGAKQAVAAAKRALGKEGLAQALPYMQFASLSGATTADLKLQKGLLQEVREAMIAATDLNSDQVSKAKLSRISYSRKLR